MGWVSQQVSTRKQRKWYDLGPEAMLDVPPSNVAQRREEMCQVCQNEWRQNVDKLDDDVRKCRRCLWSLKKLDGCCVNASGLFTVPEATLPGNLDCARRCGHSVPKCGLSADDNDKPANATAAMVYTLDGTDFPVSINGALADLLGRSAHDYDFRLLPKCHTAEGDDVIAEFSDLAEAAEG